MKYSRTKAAHKGEYRTIKVSPDFSSLLRKYQKEIHASCRWSNRLIRTSVSAYRNRPSSDQDTLLPADSYSLFLVYGQSAEQLKNRLRLSSHRQAAWVLSLALFLSSRTFCLPFYMASIKKARIYKTDDLLWEVYVQCATRVSSARGQKTECGRGEDDTHTR